MFIFVGMNDQHQAFIRQTIEMADENVRNGNGGPFAAIVVMNDDVIGKGVNSVTRINDPTAHAEVMAIRDACSNVNHFKLENAVIYTSCEPCPMCLSAIYWARIDKIYYAATNQDAASAGFDDSFIYKQIPLPPNDRAIPALRVNCKDHYKPFRTWLEMEDRIAY